MKLYYSPTIFRLPDTPVKGSLNYFWCYYLLGLYDGNTSAYNVADDLFLQSILQNLQTNIRSKHLHHEIVLAWLFRLKPECRIDLFSDDDFKTLLTNMDFFKGFDDEDGSFLLQNLPPHHNWPIGT